MISNIGRRNFGNKGSFRTGNMNFSAGISRGQFLRTSGIAGGAVAAAGLGLGGVARAQTAPGKVEVYPTGNYPWDLNEVNAAVNGGIGPSGINYAGGGIVLLKATNIAGQYTAFNFGTGHQNPGYNACVGIHKDVKILGEFVSPFTPNGPEKENLVNWNGLVQFKDGSGNVVAESDRTVLYGGLSPLQVEGGGIGRINVEIGNIWFDSSQSWAVLCVSSKYFKMTNTAIMNTKSFWDFQVGVWVVPIGAPFVLGVVGPVVFENNYVAVPFDGNTDYTYRGGIAIEKWSGYGVTKEITISKNNVDFTSAWWTYFGVNWGIAVNDCDQVTELDVDSNIVTLKDLYWGTGMQFFNNNVPSQTQKFKIRNNQIFFEGIYGDGIEAGGFPWYFDYEASLRCGYDIDNNYFYMNSFLTDPEWWTPLCCQGMYNSEVHRNVIEGQHYSAMIINFGSSNNKFYDNDSSGFTAVHHHVLMTGWADPDWNMASNYNTFLNNNFGTALNYYGVYIIGWGAENNNNIFTNNNYGSAGIAGIVIDWFSGSNNTFTNENFLGNFPGWAPPYVDEYGSPVGYGCIFLHYGTTHNKITALKNSLALQGFALCNQVVDMNYEWTGQTTNEVPGLIKCSKKDSDFINKMQIKTQEINAILKTHSQLREKRKISEPPIGAPDPKWSELASKIRDCYANGGTWNSETDLCE